MPNLHDVSDYLILGVFDIFCAQFSVVCKIPLLARRTRPSAARDDRVSCIQSFRSTAERYVEHSSTITAGMFYIAIKRYQLA